MKLQANNSCAHTSQGSLSTKTKIHLEVRYESHESTATKKRFQKHHRLGFHHQREWHKGGVERNAFRQLCARVFVITSHESFGARVISNSAFYPPHSTLFSPQPRCLHDWHNSADKHNKLRRRHSNAKGRADSPSPSCPVFFVAPKGFI